MPGAVDLSELLNVDVDQLTRRRAFIADRRLKAQSPELAHPDPRQDPRDGRERHIQALGDLRAGHPQTPQRSNDLDTLLSDARGRASRCRGAIKQALLALRSKAS